MRVQVLNSSLKSLQISVDFDKVSLPDRGTKLEMKMLLIENSEHSSATGREIRIQIKKMSKTRYESS